MKNRKGFTLVEMLIVIVIIGILAAYILPKLLGAQDKAKDVARVAALNTIGQGMIDYALDNNGEFPGNDNACGGLNTIIADFPNFTSRMEDVPTDPNPANVVGILGSDNGSDRKGQFGYCKIKKNTNPDSAIVLIAKVDSPSQANWIADNEKISSSSEYVDIQNLMCTKFEEDPNIKKSTRDEKTGKCTYAPGKGHLYKILLKS